MSIEIRFFDASGDYDGKNVTLSELVNLKHFHGMISISVPVSSLVEEILDSITTPLDFKRVSLHIVADNGVESIPSFGNNILTKIISEKIRFERIRFDQNIENPTNRHVEITYDNCIFVNEGVCPVGYSITLESCTLLDDSISDELVRSNNTSGVYITGLNMMSLRRIHLQYPAIATLFISVNQMSRPIDASGIVQCSNLVSLSISERSPVLRANIGMIPTVAMPNLERLELNQADRYTSSWIAKKILQPKPYDELKFALFPGAFTASELMTVGMSANKISLDIWDPDVPFDFLLVTTSKILRKMTINFMEEPRGPFEIPNLYKLKLKGMRFEVHVKDGQTTAPTFGVYAFWGKEAFVTGDFSQFNLSDLRCPQTPDWVRDNLYESRFNDMSHMPTRVEKSSVPPDVYKFITQKIRQQGKRGSAELHSLIGNGEVNDEVNTVIYAPYGGSDVSQTQTFTNADNVTFLYQFAHHLGFEYTINDPRVPPIFHELLNWTIGLTDDDKMSIFYYTTGHAPRQFNQVLAKQIGAGVLSSHQLLYLRTLLRVFEKSPKTKEPFRVYRGFPHGLDGGLFNSASTKDLVAKDFADRSLKRETKGYVNNPLGINTGKCCMHVITVKPGAHVLYMPDEMKQISRYSESEVLFAPFMGQFVQTNITIEGGYYTMHWTYEPYSDKKIKDNLDLMDLFKSQADDKIPIQSRKSSRIAGKEAIGPVAFNVRHPGGLHEGREVVILKPHVPSAQSTYRNSHKIATFIPNQTGVPRNAFTDSKPFLDVLPQTSFARNFHANRDTLIEQVPSVTPVTATAFKHNWGAGLVIFEPDGRVWIAHPTNGFGGDRATFPRGSYDDSDMTDLRTTAVREVFEETGIFGAIVAYGGSPLIGGVSNTQTQTDWMSDLRGSGVFADVFQDGHKRVRYYLARRIAGSPLGTGWESQAVSLAPLFKLREIKVGVRLLHDESEEVNGDNALVDFLLDPSVQADIIRSYGTDYFTAPLVSIDPIGIGSGEASAGAGGMVSFGTFVRKYMQKHENEHPEYAEYKAKLKYNKALHLFFTNR